MSNLEIIGLSGKHEGRLLQPKGNVTLQEHLASLASRSKVSINGDKFTNQEVKHGDRLEIGDHHFIAVKRSAGHHMAVALNGEKTGAVAKLIEDKKIRLRGQEGHSAILHITEDGVNINAETGQVSQTGLIPHKKLHGANLKIGNIQYVLLSKATQARVEEPAAPVEIKEEDPIPQPELTLPASERENKLREQQLVKIKFSHMPKQVQNHLSDIKFNRITRPVIGAISAMAGALTPIVFVLPPDELTAPISTFGTATSILNAQLFNKIKKTNIVDHASLLAAIQRHGIVAPEHRDKYPGFATVQEAAKTHPYAFVKGKDLILSRRPVDAKIAEKQKKSKLRKLGLGIRRERINLK